MFLAQWECFFSLCKGIANLINIQKRMHKKFVLLKIVTQTISRKNEFWLKSIYFTGFICLCKLLNNRNVALRPV
ncbi:hypothetical protein CN553_31410 [Bacillus cereus]|uniref:Uncharacterized protein n=1 Tax=Bacillus cereus TaxID=1396 RepID=A0A9X6U5J5_BACCE|nr:hypothetical protein CN553_31410 [Bacillus cereus]